MSNNSLLKQWRELAYGQEMRGKKGERFWGEYFVLEKEIYKGLLADPDNVVKGTVKELAEKYDLAVLYMVGFLDGINDSLKEPNPIEEMTEDTEVNLGFDIEKLYRNMVDCKADWLYELPEWDALLTEERRKELYKEQKASGTVVKDKKVGRNDPCPCGSGKKYKFCCGR
ncbi:MAG: SEC-C domain-containing protein [Lachnospiraceae bacterium]|nr:SEC-C domain-containing protein [Lachnospiraceae bacterium]